MANPLQLDDESQPDFLNALAAERRRNALRMAMLRVVILSVFLVRMVYYLGTSQTLWGGAEILFTAYWTLSVLVWALAQRYEVVASLSSLAIPFLDMPIIMAIDLFVLERVPESELDVVVISSAAVRMLLVTLTVLTLQVWQIVLATLMAVAMTILSGEIAAFMASGIKQAVRRETYFAILLILSLAIVCLYARHRMIQLVLTTARQEMRSARLRRFFSPEVARLVEQLPDSDRGSTREVTVLFNDVRDFTALSAPLSSQEVVAMLNEFHSRMVAVVFDEGGTLDKFLGDGLMAYFGAPVEQPDHAERAVRCAVRMQEALAILNGERAARGQPPLRMGVGIHSGQVTIGSIGSPSRREFTAIGETVNLAARVQELTKVYDGEILLTEHTRQYLRSAVPVEPVATAQVRGLREPVQLYRPSASS